MKKNLHPGAKWLFRVRGYFGAIFLIFFLFFFVLSAGAFLFSFLGSGGFILVLLMLLVFFIAGVVVLAEIYARMAYNRWFYEIGPDNIRLERGIIWKKYSNIPYERVQNIDINRGILARMFGFSSLQIQTAGYSIPTRGYGGHSEGYIPAVELEEAEKIREFVLKKIKGKKSGL